jgi:Reverse transcriptase (RNA-dependent DNA polymerase)
MTGGLRSGTHRSIGRSATHSRTRSDKNPGRGGATGRANFGRGGGLATKDHANDTISVRQKLNDLSPTATKTSDDKDTILNTKSPKQKSEYMRQDHDSTRKPKADKVKDTPKPKADKVKATPKPKVAQVKETGKPKSDQQTSVSAKSETKVRASKTPGKTKQHAIPTEADKSRETLESLLQIFSMGMQFKVNDKLLNTFAELGISDDKQFIQMTCAEVSDLFNAIFFTDSIRQDTTKDDLDHFIYTSEVVAVMIWVHEYFLNQPDIEMVDGRFIEDIGYDTMLERGIPSDAYLSDFMTNRWDYIEQVQQEHSDILARISADDDMHNTTPKVKHRHSVKKHDISVQKEAFSMKSKTHYRPKVDKVTQPKHLDKVTMLHHKLSVLRATRSQKTSRGSKTMADTLRNIKHKNASVSKIIEKDPDYEPSEPSSSTSSSYVPSDEDTDDSLTSIGISSDPNSASNNESAYSSSSSNNGYVYPHQIKKTKDGRIRRKRLKIPKNIPAINHPDCPPIPSKLRGRKWISRGLRAASSERRINRRSKLDQSVKWNGTDVTFPNYEHVIEGWMDQNGMGYMNRPEFVKVYKDDGWDEAKYLAIAVSTEQFSLDNEILFGALRSSAQQRGLRYVEKYLDTRDGLKVWLKFKDIFGGDNNLSLKISRLQSELDTPYTESYHGGFLAYIEQIAYIFSRMDTLDPNNTYHKYSNQKQCDTLRVNFAGDHNYQHITYQYYDDMERINRFDLDEYVDRLTKYYQHNERAFNKTLRRANVVHNDHHVQNRDARISYSTPSNAENDIGTFSAAYAAYQQNMNRTRAERAFDVPQAYFTLIRKGDPTLLKEIFEFRDKLETRVKDLQALPANDGTDKIETKRKDQGSDGKIDISKPQYERRTPNAARANKTESVNMQHSTNIPDVNNLNEPDDGTIDTDGSDTDTETRFSPDECAKALAVMNYINHVNNSRALHIRTLQLSERLSTAMRLSSRELESIVDSGADTMVLGEGWHFTYLFPHRSIRIVGFDETKTKHACQIGTACTVMHDVNGKPFLMIAHEAIQNSGSYTSLLSESQMRHNGLIVDSTSEKHLGIDEKPGTQSIYSADRTTQFHMQQKFGLMCIPHRIPTEDEIIHLPRFELTTDDPWNPASIHDDAGATQPFSDHIFDTVAVHAYKDEETSTIATNFIENNESVTCEFPSNFEPHRLDNPLPGYRKAAQILAKYTIENDSDFIFSTNGVPTEVFGTDSCAFMVTAEMFRDDELTNIELPNDIRITNTFYTSFDESRCLSVHQDTTILPTNDDPKDVVDLTITNKPYNLDGNMHDFLQSLSDRELLGYNEPFQSFDYHSRTCFLETSACYAKGTPVFHNAVKYRPYLGFRPLEVVRQTIANTTQMAKLSVGIPMRRHVQSLFPFLNRRRIDETVATDTFFASTDDVSGAKCAQIFYGLTSHFMNIFSLRTESDGPKAFEDFARSEGLPNAIRSDNSKMQRYSKKLIDRLREWRVKNEFTEPHHPQQNPAELRAIRWLKRNIQVLRMRTGAPETVWFWMAKYLVDIHNITSDVTLGWKTPWSKRRGETPDISAFLQFRFYEPVYYLDTSQPFPSTKEKLGYWLGITDNVGDKLCFHILTSDTHKVIERSVVRSAETRNLTINMPCDEYTPMPTTVSQASKAEDLKIDDDSSSSSSHDATTIPTRIPTAHPTPHHPKHRKPKHTTRKLRRSQRLARILNVCGDTTQFTETTSISCPDSPDAVPQDISNCPNYKGAMRNINTSRQQQMRYVVTQDVLMDSGETEPDIWTPIFIYRHRERQVGRKIKLEYKIGWSDQEPTWENAYAVQLQAPFIVLDYIKRNNLEKHRLFSGTTSVLPDVEQAMSRAFAAKVGDGPKYKFGEIVPRSVAHALAIDKANGNTDWQDSMTTELRQIKEYKTFRYPKQGESLTDFKFIPYHFVFDIKFDGRKKSRLVAGGNMTNPPAEDLYSGVVDLMTIRIAHMIAKTNNLLVCAADVGNAFLYGKTREKVYIIAGREFGQETGRRLIIDGGLYGLKTSAARFHEHLSTKLRSMGYKPSKADTDFWIKRVSDHYEYIATYVDDVLVYSRDPEAVIKELQCDYILKGIGSPRYYLGGDILNLLQPEDDAPPTNDPDTTIALSAETYIKNAVEKYEQKFGCPITPYHAPMEHSYHSEEDTTNLLNPKQASLFRGLIGSANWVVTLGRFDIAYAVNNLARFNMNPRQGHFEAAVRIFGYLKAYPKGRLYVDPKPFSKSVPEKPAYDWTEFYPDATEELPHDIPKPLGVEMNTICYVDADHAHDTVTRRSVSGILLFLNGLPVKWYSKRQKTIETSSYGSELVAARIAIELIQELRYKLRMLGIPVTTSTSMYGDNMSVILNTTVPSSQLKKKHNAIAYHRVREAIAGKIVTLQHIPSTDNIADVLTKPLPVNTYQRLLQPILFREQILTTKFSKFDTFTEIETRVPETGHTNSHPAVATGEVTLRVDNSEITNEQGDITHNAPQTPVHALLSSTSEIHTRQTASIASAASAEFEAMLRPTQL